MSSSTSESCKGCQTHSKRYVLQGGPLTPHVSFCICMGLAFGSMSCLFWFCFSWFKEGFVCAAPTVLLVHWSTSLCRSSVNVPFLLLLLLAWTCSVDCARGSGHVTRLLVEDPGKSHIELRWGLCLTPAAQTPSYLLPLQQWLFKFLTLPTPGCRTPLLKEMVQAQWVSIFYHIMLPWPLTCGWNEGQGVKPEMQPHKTDIPYNISSETYMRKREVGCIANTASNIKWIYHLFYLHKFTVLLEKSHCQWDYRQGWFLHLKGSGSPPPLLMMSGPLTWLSAYFREKTQSGARKYRSERREYVGGGASVWHKNRALLV